MEFDIYNDCRYDFLFTFRENAPLWKSICPLPEFLFFIYFPEIISQIITFDKNIQSKLKKRFDWLKNCEKLKLLTGWSNLGSKNFNQVFGTTRNESFLWRILSHFSLQSSFQSHWGVFQHEQRDHATASLSDLSLDFDSTMPKLFF